MRLRLILCNICFLSILHTQPLKTPINIIHIIWQTFRVQGETPQPAEDFRNTLYPSLKHKEAMFKLISNGADAHGKFPMQFEQSSPKHFEPDFKLFTYTVCNENAVLQPKTNKWVGVIEPHPPNKRKRNPSTPAEDIRWTPNCRGHPLMLCVDTLETRYPYLGFFTPFPEIRRN